MQPKMQTLWHLAKPTQTRTKHRQNKRNPKLPNHTTKLQTPLTILRHLTKLMITHAHTKPRRHNANHRLPPSLINPLNHNKRNTHKKTNQTTNTLETTLKTTKQNKYLNRLKPRKPRQTKMNKMKLQKNNRNNKNHKKNIPKPTHRNKTNHYKRQPPWHTIPIKTSNQTISHILL